MDLKKTYPGVRDEISWKAKPDFEDGKANLLVQDLHGVHGAYYLYRTLKVPDARKLELACRPMSCSRFGSMASSSASASRRRSRTRVCSRSRRT